MIIPDKTVRTTCPYCGVGCQMELQIKDDLSNGFWSIDLAGMQRKLESIPWVRRANIRRVWPNKLTIGIDEHVVVARWNYAHLLTSSGELISPNDASEFGHLPHFIIEAAVLDVVVTRSLA